MLTYYLVKERFLSEPVIKQAGLHVSSDGLWIVIPIKDCNGSTIFNKYRRYGDTNTALPKYKYDKGGSVSLYGAEMLSLYDKNKPLFFCEGEFDCLVMRSLGYQAVSSTGGCGSYKEEWNEMLNGFEIVIVYDGDSPGRKAAIELGNKLHASKYLFPPQDHDITSLVKVLNGTLPELYIIELSHNAEERTEKNTIKLLKQIVEIQEKINNERDIEKHTFKNTQWCNDVLEYVNSKKASFKIKKVKNIHKDSSIEDLKKIPITNYLAINSQGFCNCLWHADSTPSMKYYPDSNTLYCFGCNTYADVISVIQKKHNMSFKEAVNYLKNN